MARKFVIACDGCGADMGGPAGAEAADGPLRVEAALPLLGEAAFSVRVAHAGPRSLDLCDGCRRRVCAACGSADAQAVWDPNPSLRRDGGGAELRGEERPDG